MTSASPFHENMVEALTQLKEPSTPLPKGACDTHAHVFGPYGRFPLAASPPNAPPLAPVDSYLSMLDRVGLARGVIVQTTAYGFNNAALLDALMRAPDRLRGVAVAAPDTDDAELKRMDTIGVRGLRFLEPHGHMGPKAPPTALTFAHLEGFAPRLKKLGWHAVLWARADQICSAVPMLRKLNIPIVIDHMGLFDLSQGVKGDAFQGLLQLLANENFWIKTTALRNSQQFPTLHDVRPFHEALVETAPDRILWGSDWPFIALGDRLPNTGQLLDTAKAWTSDEAAWRRMMEDNPATLYGFN